MCIFLFSEILKWIAMDIENVALTKEIDIEETHLDLENVDHNKFETENLNSPSTWFHQEAGLSTDYSLPQNSNS